MAGKKCGHERLIMLTQLLMADPNLDATLAHCRERKAFGNVISDGAARLIASMYHNGTGTRSHQFMLTGYMSGDYNKVWEEMFIESAGGYPNEDERLFAQSMHAYLQNRSNMGKYGAVEKWDTSPI